MNCPLCNNQLVSSLYEKVITFNNGNTMTFYPKDIPTLRCNSVKCAFQAFYTLPNDSSLDYLETLNTKIDCLIVLDNSVLNIYENQGICEFSFNVVDKFFVNDNDSLKTVVNTLIDYTTKYIESFVLLS